MTRKIMIILLVSLFTSVVFADEIHLKDGSLIKGKIIQIKKKTIEYDPDGANTFDIINKNDVKKIITDDGKEINLSYDSLYMKNKKIIRGVIKKITKDSIIISEGKDAPVDKTIPRKDVVWLKYSDGKVFYMGSKQHKKKKWDAIPVMPEGGFHDSWVRIAIFGAVGFCTKGIFDKERKVFRAYKADLMQSYYVPKNFKMINGFAGGGADLDILLPAIKFMQKKSFDFTGIKFGVRGRYGYEMIESMIQTDDNYSDYNSNRTFHNKLMHYSYWAAGPTMDLIFSPRSNIFNLLLHFYVVGGQVFSGKIRAAAALRSAKMLTALYTGSIPGMTPYLPLVNIYHSAKFNTAAFKGYTIRGGIGPQFTLNKFFPITVGTNITYAYTKIELDKALPIYYSGDKKSAHHEWGCELSVGIHL